MMEMAGRSVSSCGGAANCLAKKRKRYGSRRANDSLLPRGSKRWREISEPISSSRQRSMTGEGREMVCSWRENEWLRKAIGGNIPREV